VLTLLLLLLFCTCCCTAGRGTEGARSSYSSGGRGSHGSNMNINGIENMSPGSLSRLTPAMSAVTGVGKAATKTVLKRAKGLGEGAKRGVLVSHSLLNSSAVLVVQQLQSVATTASTTSTEVCPSAQKLVVKALLQSRPLPLLLQLATTTSTTVGSVIAAHSLLLLLVLLLLPLTARATTAVTQQTGCS
jgi:hypothetical protein